MWPISFREDFSYSFKHTILPQSDMQEFLTDIKTWNGRKLQLWEKFAMLVKAKKISRSFERKVCEKRRLSNNHFATNFNWNFSKRRECVLLYETLSELEMGDLIFHSSWFYVIYDKCLENIWATAFIKVLLATIIIPYTFYILY